ncbi:MAG: metallophosphoesterase [Deltaproteobacteria bacterium]|nr:metallophosphoesterase [Deltaproteobacteria bacterium]
MEAVRSRGPSSDKRDDGSARITAMIDLLVTVSYIDGVFADRERAFLQRYVDSVIVVIEQSAVGTPEERARLSRAWRAHFEERLRVLEGEIAVLAQEVLAAAAAGGDTYVASRLRVRAVSLFRDLPPPEQANALELVTGLIHADGVIAPNERSVHGELHGLLTAQPARPPVASPTEKTLPPTGTRKVAAFTVTPYVRKELVAVSHPLLDPIEQTLSPHPAERKAQIEWDYNLLHKAMQQWQRARAAGQHRLNGITDIDQLPIGARFLDRYIHVQRPTGPIELVVLGDLHGCYSCLKAALLQSNFIQRAWAHQWDPVRNPDVKLVLLGDYIDRGRFSFDGVLRAALHLFVALPDHVILLRGNHEWLRWIDNRITSGVYPAEALASLAPHVPLEMLEAYRLLFEHMPTSFLCERTLFVHAGIPRDDTFAERYRDLGSLNDDDMRFQMMWSDPVATDHIPVELQRMDPRFSFGRKQFVAFMERTGLHTLVRGHEKIDRGFDAFYSLGEHTLVNLFSSGGADNDDLPFDSSYRRVTPMALSVQAGPGHVIATPWQLHYRAFNYAPHNGLYRRQPVLEYRYG